MDTLFAWITANTELVIAVIVIVGAVIETCRRLVVKRRNASSEPSLKTSGNQSPAIHSSGDVNIKFEHSPNDR